MTTEYQQRDLGYPRTPTSAKLRVMFKNGEMFDVPVQVVVDDRDDYYKELVRNDNTRFDTVKDVRNGVYSTCNIIDWAITEMTWDKLEPYVIKVDVPPIPFDHESHWNTADIDIIGEV